MAFPIQNGFNYAGTSNAGPWVYVKCYLEFLALDVG